ncbi:hypothetical protein [Candidatus Borrarchaeum sp.]|uniref:hypothetical protein n=1 Tax=Candidatus Borrarchaeum sp. TaxID=2846742 RepID=UPI00257D21F2|nr:hypothetical protein [Candidatus Borrarchaeum sp.]
MDYNARNTSHYAENTFLCMRPNLGGPTLSTMGTDDRQKEEKGEKMKELKYEFSTQEEINKGLNCLKDVTEVTSEEMEETGSLKIKSSDRSLIMIVHSIFSKEQELTIEVYATTTTEDAENVVKECFGTPKSERKLAPSILEVSKIIIQSTRQNLDLLSEDVCDIFGLKAKHFEKYKKMIIQSASMPGALPEVKQAADKIESL